MNRLEQLYNEINNINCIEDIHVTSCEATFPYFPDKDVIIYNITANDMEFEIEISKDQIDFEEIKYAIEHFVPSDKIKTIVFNNLLMELECYTKFFSRKIKQFSKISNEN